MSPETKLKRQAADNFVDSLITSIWALYITIISFAVLYTYIGFTSFERDRNQSKLIALDELLALRWLTIFQPSLNFRPARKRDLPAYFTKALDEHFEEAEADLDAPEKDQPAPSKFDATLVPSSRVAVNVPMRMSVNGASDVFITQLGAGESFDFFTQLMEGGSHTVASEKVQLAIFSTWHSTLSWTRRVLILELDDGQYAFAIPRALETAFLRIPNMFIESSVKLTRLAELMPDMLRPYAQVSDELVYLHGKAVDYLILNFANEQLGKHLTPNQLDDAVQQLYERKERDASYFGISATSTQLIRVGPLIYFMLSFELWRRVRRLPSGRLNSDKYWFAFETTDILGRAYAYLYAILPVLFGIMVYALFATSQGLGLVLFGRAVLLPDLLTLTFPPVPAGWAVWDSLAFIFLLLSLIQILISVSTTRKLLMVVSVNLRGRRS
jgi:hypothetical protein